MISPLALPPQRLALESDAPEISELMRVSVLELFRRLYDRRQTASAAVHMLDPRTEPARVRAMFVRSDWTRHGLGRAILDSCERAARDEGFERLVLGATLPGEQLYRASGFREVERFTVTMPDGVEVECVGMERSLR